MLRPLIKASTVLAAMTVSTLIVSVNAIDIPSLPAKTKDNMTGFNDCQSRYGASSPDALCANSYINSIKVFCLFGPANTGPTIGDVEGEVVSYCIKSGYGTRLMPRGTIQGAQFVKTKSFLQVVGVGDLTKINILAGDDGGELDPHGALEIGNPVGGLVFTRSFDGTWRHAKEWTQFVSDKEFCFRACHGPQRAQYCEHIYDLEGCAWNMPSINGYETGKFEQCEGDEGELPGVYDGVKWRRESGISTPDPHPAPAVYNCRRKTTLGYGKPAKAIPGQPSQRSFGDDENDDDLLQGRVFYARD
ncbi:hypothetical protein IE81DRAFT_211798 [Ceraceosorus guamensis]|uniref:Carbohydrate-binding module family 13 protein n=1 Tax=Ceraceosorus guamensis TaxID=1522189 RepID=A0A316WBJ6_9BASI|nr:hypothetical protein IE81DRAFT_211798 [Ceraceosorus guamensis]PWN45303.1 hypothetical protein IE81DRAFT_211798 [Ceraceosorus guamensis]